MYKLLANGPCWDPIHNKGKLGTKSDLGSKAMFGNFMVKLYLNIRFNGLIDFSASLWFNKISISLF